MYEPKIIAYLCTWCSYTGADTAGIARLKSPANFRSIRVPCSGRVSPELIMRTFDQGADGVLVLGCHIGECHYESGNHRTAKRIPVLKALLEFTGLEPERLRLDWVSASEGERFSKIVTEFTETVRRLGPNLWRVKNRDYPYKPVYTKPYREKTQAQFNVHEMQANTQTMRDIARELLSSGQVTCVIGFETTPRNRTRPVFIYHPEEVDRLIWNQDCTHNLTTYLNHKLHPIANKRDDNQQQRIAVVVKPCDERAINIQLAEKRFERDQVHLIGMVCQGVSEIPRSTGKTSLGRTLSLQDRCLECSERTPYFADSVVGKAKADTFASSPDGQRQKWIAEIKGKSPADRMEFWLRQFDRCIRCYACRQACPVCDCPTCLYERDDSLWVGAALGWEGVGLNEKRAFHLGRAYHLAGRCIGCDECERACPMEIPISLLNQMIAEELAESFGYQAGRTSKPSPLVTILSGEEVVP
mgnify:FL=1